MDAFQVDLAAERHRSRLSHDLTAALSSAATRAQVARAVFEKGIAVFGADAGTLMLVREEHPEEVELVEQIGYSDAILSPWRRFSASLRTPITEAIRSREPVWSESREALARFPDFRPIMHAAWAALPLCVGDRAIGAIGLAYGLPRGFDADERALLLSVAQRCAQALDRARAGDRLREAVERLSIAKEAAVLGIYDYDVEAGTFRWDERVRAIWGVAPEEPVTYDTFLSGVHPADRRRTEVALAKVFNPSSGGRYEAEHRVVHRGDGDVRWVHATGLAFFEWGRAVRLVGTVQEISDAKRGEAHADLLGRLYVALVQHRPPEELVRHTLHEIAQHLEVDGAKLCQIAPSGEETVVAEVEGGRDVTPHAAGADTHAGLLPAEIRRALARGAALVVHDVVLDPRLAQGAAGLGDGGVAAFMNVPFVGTDEGPRLSLCVTSRRPRRWRTDEERLLRDVSKQLFPAIERARLEEALRSSEALLQVVNDRFGAILAATRVIAYEQDLGLRYTWISKPEGGRATEEILGSTHLEIFETADQDRIHQVKREVLETCEPRRMDVYFRGPEGDRWYDLHVHPRRERGRVVGVYGTVFDVSDRKSTEQALRAREQELGAVMKQEREARAQAEQAASLAELFVAILGHDLRNPLAAIQTAAALLTQKDGDERVLRMATRIVTSSRRMARMIDQILDFTRIRSGAGLPYKPAAMDLRELVGRVREEVPAGDKQVHVETKGATDGVWDEDRLAQALSNLLGNAVEHSPAGAAIQIVVDGRAPAHVEVAVANPGAIPAEALPEVFEPFRQARPSGSKGLGLGLFITRDIVRAHGGAIDVASSDAEGTRFRLTLPRAPSG